MDDDKLPVRAFSLRSIMLSCVIVYNEAGMLPTMFLLVSTNRFDNTLIFDMNDGMVPPKEFLPRFKYDSFVRLSIDEDITSPSRRFWLRSRYVSLVSPMSEVGMVPKRLFWLICSIDNAEAFTTLDGMEPEREFMDRIKTPRFVRLPMDEARVPVKRFRLRSKVVSLVISYTVDGMMPPILFVFNANTDKSLSLTILDGMLPMRELLGRWISVTTLL
jgi:hypothetical protein